MNLDELPISFGFQSHPISEDLIYLETTMSLAFDGRCLGFYLEDLGRERYRLSDNAETLFMALSQGYQPASKDHKEMQTLVEKQQLLLSEQGEIYQVTAAGELSFYLARMLETQFALSHYCLQKMPWKLEY
ncbi:DUF1828 domain-containing protein [Marinospirillum perlucidum]|uniref:DUF1828 domain-containing protein n=1 Tax=Marinospirillum perlucidum TaxID=1982602 RepID=UPI000DF39479|nr:DUF1828 domain-containing protein [Marinospirillum perlucidum]